MRGTSQDIAWKALGWRRAFSEPQHGKFGYKARTAVLAWQNTVERKNAFCPFPAGAEFLLPKMA